MSRRKVTTLFLVIFFSFLVWANLTKPRIMIIHSYATDFMWVREINQGFDRIFKGRPYMIRWYYLDTKRNPEEDYKTRIGAACRREVERWRPDILILIDDNAQSMVGSSFINRPDISIIFTGLNATAEKYGYDKATNVTGMLERIPFKAVHEAFSLINSKARFIHICDSSETSKAIQAELEEFDWKPLKLVETKLCPTFDDWKADVMTANASADFLLITHYHTIKDATGRVMRPREVLDWTRANATVPLIGCWDFFVEDGGMLAVSVSPFEQGEEAAKMAVQMIEKGKKPKDMPPIKNLYFTISMRGGELKSRKIKIPDIFEAFARGVNHYYD